MSDPISVRLAKISKKDPRMRSDADMKFLTWCSTGGKGPPPPDEAPAVAVPQSNAAVMLGVGTTPASTSVQVPSGAPPKPTAAQLEAAFRAIVAKPQDQRTPQENQFLIGIQK